METKSIENRVAALLQKANDALERQEQILAQQRPPACGDVYAHPVDSEHRVLWALLVEHPEEDGLFLVVPADDNALVGGLDVGTSADTLFGRHTLRCAHQLWIPARRLSELRRIGELPPSTLDAARRKLSELLEGPPDDEKTMASASVDEDPEYADWMSELASLCAQLRTWLEPQPLRWARPQPPRPQPARRRAHAAAYGVLGAAGAAPGWRVQTERLAEVNWYAGELEVCIRADELLVEVIAAPAVDDPQGTLTIFVRLEGDQELKPQRVPASDRRRTARWPLSPAIVPQSPQEVEVAIAGSAEET